MHRLHPSVLDRGGLVMALGELAVEVERSHRLKVTTVFPPAPIQLLEAQSLAMYRISQEALRNVVRHAGVREAQLWLEDDRRGCVLSITDTGQGMDLSRHDGRRGIGLIGMRERAVLAGGDLKSPGNEVDSQGLPPLGEAGEDFSTPSEMDGQ